MTTPVDDTADLVAAYDDAFEELWQQTCRGCLSVAEVRERMLALRERFGGPGLVPPRAPASPQQAR